ncbi:MAG: hypothetical protein Kow0069_37220 [Promethearchaeota archaeon]
MQKLFVCQVCGFIADDEAPDACPRCGAPKDKFSELAADKAELVLKSRKTNYLHMKISQFLVKIMKNAEEGEKINLDPGCLAIFQKLIRACKDIYENIQTEIKVHVEKGKWQ